MSQLPDVQLQCQSLAEQLRPLLADDPAIIGIHTGGVWLAAALHQRLGLTEPVGVIDVSFYRDDFAEKGLHPQVRPSEIPFEVEGRHLILVDDVLYTGRTIRAALNEIFDYGRPASVTLAVLADRGGRELPVYAECCVWEPDLADDESLVLNRADDGTLSWSIEHV
jgi:pyrimidine operon attenuation protein/uracil phosphoribosyltransferase